MEILVSILQIFGLLAVVLVVIALAARSTLQGRAARRANKTARIGVEAPADEDDAGNGAGGRAAGR